MIGAGLTLRILRLDRRNRVSVLLTAFGVALGTALVVLLLTLPSATAERNLRSSWQQPQPTQDEPAALVASSVDYVGDQELTRLDVAALGQSPGDDVPLADGIPTMPAPSEVILSPALAELAAELPENQLADRFGDNVVDELDQSAVAYPEQLVAVVGQPPEALAETGVPVAGLDHAVRSPDFLLTLLTGVGVVLLAVPSAVLVASVSRLTAARRDRRLAALRLAGATPAQVVGVVATETAVGAVAGTALGLLATWPLRAAMRLVPWDGGTWQLADFNPPAWVLLTAGLGVPALVILSAVLGLRRVVRTPLGVTAAHRKRLPSAWRLLIVVPVVALFLYGLTLAESGSLVVLLASLAVIGLSASVIGPWLTAAIGVLFSRLWRRPAMLLAGRRLADDPRAAYRSCSGIVLAVFIGSMVLTLLPGFDALSGGGRSFRDPVLYVDVPTAGAAATAAAVSSNLDEYGVTAPVIQAGRATLRTSDGRSIPALTLDCESARAVTRMPIDSCHAEPAIYLAGTAAPGELRVGPRSGAVAAESAPNQSPPREPQRTETVHAPVQQLDLINGEVPSAMIDPRLIDNPSLLPTTTIAVPAPADQAAVVRTAVTAALPGYTVSSRQLYLAGQQTTLADLRRVTAIGLVIAAVLAGASAGVTAAGSVIDRRKSFGALLAAGTPRRLLARALRTEAALPALVATLGAGLAGVGVAMGLLHLFRAPTLLTPALAAPLALGVLMTLLATSLSGPVLRRIATEPLSEE